MSDEIVRRGIDKEIEEIFYAMVEARCVYAT